MEMPGKKNRKKEKNAVTTYPTKLVLFQVYKNKKQVLITITFYVNLNIGYR